VARQLQAAEKPSEATLAVDTTPAP
jgi:hypothetical protein